MIRFRTLIDLPQRPVPVAAAQYDEITPSEVERSMMIAMLEGIAKKLREHEINCTEAEELVLRALARWYPQK